MSTTRIVMVIASEFPSGLDISPKATNPILSVTLIS
jgi:hypothetical protein